MKNLLQNLLVALSLLATHNLIAQNFNMELRSTLEYPGQTLANICGYARDGREYALLGGSAGLIIVDVTNPASPVTITQIPGPNNLWKEIKVYDHYAYVTSEGGQGLQIVDLSGLPGTSLNYHYYTGDGEIENQLDAIHALHIDVKKGFVYLFGGPLLGGAAKVLDLNTDPYNPTYVGKFDALGYIHDGFADNDTLYACHIYTGLLSITDMSDKQNPVLLGTVQTPGKFTHNAWITDDRKHILTTDEDLPSFVTSYDVSDPSDIKELDRTSTNDGNNSIGHNTHVLGDWAVTSWYTDGVVISDVHKADNMVITGWYDTWAGSGPNFDGCWGVYPFLPSGTIVASNIPNTNGGTGKLYVLSPTYTRACYLEGKITNACNGQPVTGATITVSSNNPWINTTSNNLGVFKTGQVEPGSFQVTISKPGFEAFVTNVNLATAQVTELDVQLTTANATNVAGTVLSASNNQPVASASVVLEGASVVYEVQTDAAGQYTQECAAGGAYTIRVGAWGYLTQTITVPNIGTSIPTVYLEAGYEDDFGLDLGWSTETNAASGAWERGEPVGTIVNNDESNPDDDIDTDTNDECYVTGNGGGQAGNDDVDNGSVTLTSPTMKLAGNDDAILSFWYWFFNGGGQGNPNDKFEVRALNGTQSVLLFGDNVSASDWNFSGDIHLKDYITLNDNVRIQFTTADDAPGHLVEAAVDGFKVVPVKSSGINPDIDVRALLQATPNPATTEFALRYEWSEAGSLTLEVRNALGQIVQTQALGTANGIVRCGTTWPTGVYFATLRSAGRQSAPLRLIKQ